MRLIVQGTLENPERVPKVQSAQAPNLSGKRTEHNFFAGRRILSCCICFFFFFGAFIASFFCFVGGCSFKKEIKEGKKHERSITKNR